MSKEEDLKKKLKLNTIIIIALVVILIILAIILIIVNSSNKVQIANNISNLGIACERRWICILL